MYGRGGNYAPQFGQGLQRPMPPYQQPPAGHPPPPPFQPGQPIQMHPIIQQGGLPHGGPPRGPGYPHGPFAMPPQGPPNGSQSFLQQPLVHGGPPPRHPYHGAPPPPPPSIGTPRVPPPPLQHPAGYGVVGPRSTTPPSIHHMSLPPPPPPPPRPQEPTGFFTYPPPPPASSLPIVPNPPSSSHAGEELSGQNQMLEPASTVKVKTDNGEGSVPLELSPPPPKPTDETVLRNIEVLCQFIAKNGSQFEEMARQNELGNPKFSFLVGGDPGSEASCAREYYLWMKKKYGLLNDLDNSQEQKNLSQSHADGEASVALNSPANVATVHSPADSDVDMEDDITQTDKEPDIYESGEDMKFEPASTGEVLEMQEQDLSCEDLKSESALTGEVMEMQKQDLKSGEDLKSEPASTGEVFEMQKQETMPLHTGDNSSALNLQLPVKSEEVAETKPEDSSSQLGSIDSPFRLIPNYASDDNSEDELPYDQGEAQAVPAPPKLRLSTLSDDNKSGAASEPGIGQTLAVCVDSSLVKQETLVVPSESQETSTKVGSSGKHGIRDKNDGDDPSDLKTRFHVTRSRGFDNDASHDTQIKDKKTAHKVDEFGRLVKEGASDSESDGTRQVRRRGRRDRSRSRSRSPSDRKRRSPWRSPRRRKGRRSRSRSWSPKRRRSRSRSPYRSGGEFAGEMLRRGKPQTQECMDYLKGKCYRGASCRYLHLDVDKSESSRRYKGKQYQVNVASARNSELGDRVTPAVSKEHNDMKGGKKPYHSVNNDDDDLTLKNNDENFKVESTIDGIPNALREEADNSVNEFQNSEDKREDPARVEGTSEVHMPHPCIGGEYPTFGMPSTSEAIHHSSAKAPQEDVENPTTVASSKIDSSVADTSLVSPKISTESYQGFTSNKPTIANANFPNQISHPPLPHFSQAITPPVTFPVDIVPSQHARLPSQQSHYPDPTNSAWGILPPPQPRPSYVIDSSISGPPLQFQQGNNPLRTDSANPMSLRAQTGELAEHSQVSGFQYQTYHLPSGSASGTPFAGHGSMGSFTPGVPPQSSLFPGDPNVMQSFPGSNMFTGDSSRQADNNNQLLQQRPPASGSSLTTADNVPSHLGGSQPVSGYASDPLVREQPSRYVHSGRPGISAHYNPYASTFDQPLSSRFSSAFAQERVSSSGMKYDGSFSLSNVPSEGQAASGYGSRQFLSSPNSMRAGGGMSRSGGDQYDPLFDSIEPSSKRSQKQDHAGDNSEMLKVGSHLKVLDVAENKQKEVVATTSLENDEYGETADAEVGAVENGSLSDTDDDAIVAEGDIEIDQIKPGGNNGTSKDSRSMKLFKVAVANFVKEVLKPQWRQGNMSKEVFKTIVKKTVDKVSGAMKNHRVPKSQAKIDHYIDSSRRKLTQLVEGYVSKYKS
ncbi:uncharacterized protein LOC141652766 isoform X2 [Silene latifolia]|uniref:uncharacterized protein LOC141652766 isoform X2 n=1 Tax=Silene latifolia TaxID=37657 RepID=UPI003D77D98A